MTIGQIETTQAITSSIDGQAPLLSIVAPIYNEEGNIEMLYQRIEEVMTNAGVEWELVCVNDGSKDDSERLLDALYQAHPEHVRVVHFSRNFGHQIAVTAGMEHARGDAVVLIDADLQDPPELIPDMIREWQNGSDVVYAVREEREGESWLKLALASSFYRVIDKITNVSIPLDTGDFRLMDRRVVDAVESMTEQHRFIRGMVSWVGYNQKGLPYKRSARFSGETKYPLRKQLRFAWDGITGFSYFPLQLATYMGFVVALFSLLAILLVVYLRAFTEIQFLEGQATTLIMVLFLGSIQLISLGIIGEYLGRIYNEVKDRPLYIVKDRKGIDDGEGNVS